jgi:hypothetical protein
LEKNGHFDVASMDIYKINYTKENDDSSQRWIVNNFVCSDESMLHLYTILVLNALTSLFGLCNWYNHEFKLRNSS